MICCICVVISALVFTLKGTCSDGWNCVSKKYFMIVYEKVVWQEAVTKCNEYGGQLAKVENELEDSWLISQLTDSSPINYTNWLPTEPNGGTEENCVNYCKSYCRETFYGWNDTRCKMLLGYVCERHSN